MRTYETTTWNRVFSGLIGVVVTSPFWSSILFPFHQQQGMLPSQWSHRAIASAPGRSFVDGSHRRLLPEAYAATEGAGPPGEQQRDLGPGNQTTKVEHGRWMQMYGEIRYGRICHSDVIQRFLFESHSCKFIYTTSFWNNNRFFYTKIQCKFFVTKENSAKVFTKLPRSTLSQQVTGVHMCVLFKEKSHWPIWLNGAWGQLFRFLPGCLAITVVAAIARGLGSEHRFLAEGGFRGETVSNAIGEVRWLEWPNDPPNRWWFWSF